MKKQKQNTQSIIQAIAAGTALLQVLAVSLVTLGFVLSANANERKTTIITFDAPGAVNGTEALAINPEGAITGDYHDANYFTHGFLRARNGSFITFDPPGSYETIPFSINPAGTITGTYSDFLAIGVSHGFVRATDGTITTFDVPGAGTDIFQGTKAGNINPAGIIAGNYVDASFVSHGFVRYPSGIIIPFDAPGQYTDVEFPDGLNPAGEITGFYIDASFKSHLATGGRRRAQTYGFVRATNGVITTLNVPSKCFAINNKGTVTGYYFDGFVIHGLVRAPNGDITTFDAPGAGTGGGGFTEGTAGLDINPVGTITGNYVDASLVSHGFVRATDGTITTFDVPGAGTSQFLGTLPQSLNPAGTIVGVYLDANNVPHGFLRGGE